MHSNFAEKTKDVLRFATEEAIRLRSNEINADHLLLGVLRQGNNVVIEYLKRDKVDLTVLKGYIEGIIYQNSKTDKNLYNKDNSNLRYSPDAQHIINSAIIEAEKYGQREVAPEHLFLAYFVDEKNLCSGAKFLAESGVSYWRIVFYLRKEGLILAQDQANSKKASNDSISNDAISNDSKSFEEEIKKFIHNFELEQNANNAEEIDDEDIEEDDALDDDNLGLDEDDEMKMIADQMNDIMKSITSQLEQSMDVSKLSAGKNDEDDSSEASNDDKKEQSTEDNKKKKNIKKPGKGKTRFGFAIQQPMAINLSGLIPGQNEASKDPLKEYGTNLNEAAKNGKIDPITGRTNEIAQLVEILGKRRKHNPLLIGEPGVGKSAIVEGIAARINEGNVPESLKNKQIISIDMGAIVAGTQYRGSFEARLKAIIKQCSNNPNYILFADEIHTIIGAGHSEGGLDAANILKPALARGDIQCIGATTIEEYSKTIEKDGALNRRFQTIMIEPTNFEDTLEILYRSKENYEKFHNVKYTDEALKACITLTERYITTKHLPDKAINAMDAAGSSVQMHNVQAKSTSENKDIAEDKNIAEEKIVTENDVANIIARITGIPVNRISESKRKRLINMDKSLKSKVIGQDQAVDTIVRAIKRNVAGLKNPNRPIGSFLFMGPTGVGKTKLAKSLAEYLFDAEENMIRIDMSEYSDKFDVTKLIGAPPGYVGYNEGGQLTEKVRHKPYSVVLLDEIEKANPEVFNTLLQVLDDGRLTDGNGRIVNFRNTIIIMTSNVGSSKAEAFGNKLGFTTPDTDESAERKRIITKSIKETFAPEFINRIDELVYFNSLGVKDISKIVDIELLALNERVKESGCEMTISKGVKDLIIENGYDPAYGARPLKRAITKFVEDPLSEAIINENIVLEPSSEKSEKRSVLRVILSGNRKDSTVKLT